MRKAVFTWLRRERRLLSRELIVLLCALALGLGYSLWTADTYLPSIDGNIYSILAMEDSLLMVLANGNSNSLVRIDRTGALFNYMDTANGQAFQYLESDGETVYAILSHKKGGTTRQSLVSLSLKNASMRTRPILELTDLRGAPAEVTWREIYLSTDEERPLSLELTGTDGQGRGYLAHLDLATGHIRFEEILPDENILFLKYVEEGHYVWVNREREAGQYIDGIWQRNILAGLSDTPLHISTCGTRCFISDSVSGDIFEILPDGTALRLRQGEDDIGNSGFQFRQFEVYTTYLGRDDTVRFIGLCAARDGGIIAGEDWSIRALRPGMLRLLMLWQHGWLAAIIAWAVLAAFVESIHAILRAPRLSVRLLLCEAVAAVVLLTSVTAVQYHSFRETILTEADQKLRLIGGSLAATLTSGGQGGSGSVDMAVNRLEWHVSTAMARQETGYDVYALWEKEYDVCVLWETEYGPVIVSNSAIPAGYQLEDVVSREYLSVVSRAIRQNKAILERIQTDTNYDYLFAQSFSQGGHIGCVAVSQNEEVMLSGQARFLQRLLPILAACPILFLALVWITRRLLRPLDEIQRALEEFYTHGSGCQIRLDDMPRTELYEVGRVFNQLSVQTKVQFNELQSINAAYARLVPDCLLDMLHKRSMTQIRAGDHAPVEGALLVLVPRDFSANWASLNRLAGLAAGPIARFGGMLVDYDEGLSALTALFPQKGSAHSCALDCLNQMEQAQLPVMAAVLTETVELGVLGCEHLLYSFAVSGQMRRKQAALERVLPFGAALVQNGSAGRTDLRLLGWDGELEIYEDPACRPSDWQSRWRASASLWKDALRLFRKRDFPAAMRLFSKMLWLMPEDMAARWYLFRCEALRGGASRPPDTGLLFDWEEPGHE